jgi:aminoglycoside/choline kinase family phosphotransferase
MFDAPREAAIETFLARTGWSTVPRTMLAGDASFRKYYRLNDGTRRAVLMDAPPPKEDVRPFVTVARHLVGLGLSAPRIVAEDPDDGLLLLEDFGDDTFTRCLAADAARENALYTAAIDVLIDLHGREDAAKAAVPPYDDDRLIGEARLFVDWYLPAVSGRPTAADMADDFVTRWKRVLPLARGGSDTLVLRDYHVDNLMWLGERSGVAACGLLDFQDAVIGPAAYDLVSLLEDARRDVSPALARGEIARYLAAFPNLDADRFMTAYAILGAMRNAKIIGIFTRLMARDGKPQYLSHIPRLWRLLEGDLAHPALAFVREWFDLRVPRLLRVVPDVRPPVAEAS